MFSKELYNDFRQTILPGILNSYSIVFFLNNKLLAIVLIIISFFNFFAGLSGLYAVLLTLFIAYGMNIDKKFLRTGVYSFNGLLTGIGMGTFFDPGFVFFSLLTLSVLLSLFLSVTLGAWLGKYKLPHLSIPFVISFWFILLPASQFENLGLTQRNIYWINEMYAMGGNSLLDFFQRFDSLPLNNLVDLYLRSLSSIFFQSNLIAGLLIAIALLISSRIFFSLSIAGFLSAYIFAQFSGSEAASITYYNIGANYMMVAFAIGGFFLIPSKQSYLWTILLVPLTSLVLLFFYKLIGFVQLPVFSLPFSFVVIIFVYFLQLRTKASKLIITPLQTYSPESNFYNYNNDKHRLSRFLYLPLQLPFWGEWTVSQGHDGNLTHLGDWGKAFDFVITDNNQKTYRGQGLLLEDYYCYNKPIVAPAQGVIQYATDCYEDNEIGQIDTLNNWGNSIVIKHAEGIYSQLSHLKKNSIKVKVGDAVQCGDIIALCGSSGRSPEPHLHFQIQNTPALGSKTLDYPLAYFFKRDNKLSVFAQFSKPALNDKVYNTTANPLLKNAFNIQPNSSLKFAYKDENDKEKVEQWDAYTDAYNYKYLYCAQTQSTAYYATDGSMFYFTAFYGDKKSLLYYFYLAAYKVFFDDNEQTLITDSLPLNILKNNKLAIWIQDIAAPFYVFMKINFQILIEQKDDSFDSDNIYLKSLVEFKSPGKKNTLFSKAFIRISDSGIQEILFESEKKQIKATCIRD